MAGYPCLKQVVLDAEDVVELAEFYRQLLGLRYPPGREPDSGERAEPIDWLNLIGDDGGTEIAIQLARPLPRSTWPDHAVPQQLHLDMTVGTSAELEVQCRRALDLGAELLLDRSDDPEEALYVFADPAGHPFCIFVHAAPVQASSNHQT